jgi:hypothetical protein
MSRFKHTPTNMIDIPFQEEQPEGVDIFSSPPDQADVDDFFRRFSDIHALLHQMVDYFKMNTYPKETSDIFEVVTLNKQGFGGNWIPSKFQRQYMRIAAPVPTAIQVTSMLGTPFVVTVPAVAPPLFWNIWDWPDQSAFYLDTTATANNMKVWVRFTNVA